MAFHWGPVYLTGYRNKKTDRIVNYHSDDVPLGLLVQPLTARQGYLKHTEYPWLGVDNGCFTEVGQERFNFDQYMRITDVALERWGDRLLFVTAQDVAFDWKGTLKKSLPMLPKIRARGAPAALVLQDGATIGNIPWDEFDVLFIGGSTEWKIGPVAREIVRYGNSLKGWNPTYPGLLNQKTAHMGRVNSRNRLKVAADFGCVSADGTYLLHEDKKSAEAGDHAVDVMLWWLRESEKFAYRKAGWAYAPVNIPWPSEPDEE